MEGKKELSTATIGLMVGVALLYDALQILLDLAGIGWLLVPIAYFHFWLWFRLRGIKFFSMKKAKTFGINGALEVLSAGIIPAFTFNVLLVALDYKVKNSSIIKK